MKWISIFIFLFLFSCRTTSEKDTELARWQDRTLQTTIIRDDFGVPHVYGKTDADAVFGLLYAQCEDDFNRVERNYIWAIGRLAEVEGEEALYSDLRARLFMTREEAIDHYESSPPWLQELCVAFADGINYYLHTHPEVQPKLLQRFEPWMPMYFSEGSIGGDIERVSTWGIKEFYASRAQPKMPATESLSFVPLISNPTSDEEPRGSNGIALSGQLTESGNAMLLINPHTSFFFRGEVHAISEEGLNAYGAVTWGQFFIYQGFNEKTGWMHTSTYTDVIDEYVEKVEEKDGKLKYRYGDEWRPVEEQEVSLQYLEDGAIKSRNFTIYRTHHGPITHQQDGQWVATALMWEPVKALNQSYTRTKLDGLKAFTEMMEMKTNSSNNTVYADAGGNIAYFHGNFIPERDTQFNYSAPVDGSNPATDWQGLHPVDEAIVIVNPPTGWIQNCNSTPFTAAGEYSPKKENYPYYMSIDRENFRGVHALQLLKEANDMTLDKLIELAYDPYLPGFEQLISGLIAAYDQSSPKNEKLAGPIGVLRDWDLKTSAESVAMSLAHYYGNQYRRQGKAPDGLSFMEQISYFGTGSPLEERLNIFAEAINQIESDFGNWKTPWGEINRYQRINGDIRQPFNDAKPSLPVGLASGRWGALASFGAQSYPGTKRIYGTSGNSFVAVVEFGDRLRAKSMLAGGQSGDPDSPHFDDQAQRYIDVQFKEVAYYREDVERRAEAKYHPGPK